MMTEGRLRAIFSQHKRNVTGTAHKHRGELITEVCRLRAAIVEIAKDYPLAQKALDEPPLTPPDIVCRGGAE